MCTTTSMDTLRVKYQTTDYPTGLRYGRQRMVQDGAWSVFPRSTACHSPIGRQPVTYNGYDTSSPKISYCSGPRDAEFDPFPIYQSHVTASHVACICCVFQQSGTTGEYPPFVPPAWRGPLWDPEPPKFVKARDYVKRL
jgi:hypothetical protein